MIDLRLIASFESVLFSIDISQRHLNREHDDEEPDDICGYSKTFEQDYMKEIRIELLAVNERWTYTHALQCDIHSTK